MMQIYGHHSLGFVFGFCVLQSKPSADNDKHEGGKKKTQNKRRNEGLQDNKKHKSKTRQHKAESQGKAQISIKYLNGITSSK